MMRSTLAPTELLGEEHRVILGALDLVEVAARPRPPSSGSARC